MKTGLGKQEFGDVESYGETNVVYEGSGNRTRSPDGSIAGKRNVPHPVNTAQSTTSSQWRSVIKTDGNMTTLAQ